MSSYLQTDLPAGEMAPNQVEPSTGPVVPDFESVCILFGLHFSLAIVPSYWSLTCGPITS